MGDHGVKSLYILCVCPPKSLNLLKFQPARSVRATPVVVTCNAVMERSRGVIERTDSAINS